MDTTTGIDPTDAEAQPTSDESTVSSAETAAVKKWIDEVQRGKTFFKDQFKAMRDSAAFARGRQWPGTEEKKDGQQNKYVANFTLRHAANKVAALYAKNPRAVATRRKTLDYVAWDGTSQSMQEAIATVRAVSDAVRMDPSALATLGAKLAEAEAVLKDIATGSDRRKMLDRIAKTLEIVYEYEVRDQIPPFKTQMKQLVRRTITSGVGYVKLGYHRVHENRPEDVERVSSLKEQIAEIERLAKDRKEGEIDDSSADLDKLKQALKSLESGQPAYIQEGLDFDFPPSTSVIPDPACRSLHGFLGARWVAIEYLLPCDKAKEIYKVDVKSAGYAQYVSTDKGYEQQATHAVVDGKESMVCVWEIYDKSTRQVLTVADGVKQYLRAPAPPAVVLERFWPLFVLLLNEVEDDLNIFPPSDVELLMPMQREHNLSRQRLIEHRDAARPRHVTAKGALTGTDKTNFEQSGAHDVIELDGMTPGAKILDIIQRVPTSPIDQALYETESTFSDALKTVGGTEANVGGTSNGTATESSIAESSRLSSIGSNADDLDDFLTELAKAASHVLLLNMSEEAVKVVAGPGAVWPTLTAEEIARDLWLEVKAGSSGRPNKAMEIQNMERLLPVMLQIPGLSSEWLLTHLLERYDERIDPSDAFAAGLPSIIAQNAAPPPPGGALPIPAAQGAQGAEGGPGVRPGPEGDANMGPGTQVETPTGNLPAAPPAPVAPVRPAPAG